MDTCKEKMINEIEVKILNVDADKILAILKENKAKFVKDVFQRNTIYANSHTKKEKVAVRIREETNKDKKTTILTIKSPKKIVNNHKIRKEYEIIIPSFEFGDEMLKLQDYKIIGLTEIKRKYYHLNKCSVEIINMPNIPTFIEIEGDEENILKVAKLLGYSEKDYETRNVINIFKPKNNYLRFE